MGALFGNAPSGVVLRHANACNSVKKNTNIQDANKGVHCATTSVKDVGPHRSMKRKNSMSSKLLPPALAMSTRQEAVPCSLSLPPEITEVGTRIGRRNRLRFESCRLEGSDHQAS
jgi:hypothetical protein